MRALVVVLALLAVEAPAHAFPELATREGGTPCGTCHVSPGGGGLLTEYGRMEAADTLSRGGDGRALHGAIELPAWVLLGGDFRAATLIAEDVDATEGTKLAAFPMQADLRIGFQVGAFTVAATGGVRGSTRLYDGSSAPYLISTEHYAMWSDGTWSARAGRFFPVQGLRLPDHTLYVRRYTGTNLYEEPYALAAAHVGDAWELHAAAFIHDPVLAVGRREAGGSAHAELSGDAWAAAVTARVGHGADGTRMLGGVSGRLRLTDDAVLLGELDLLRDHIAEARAITQLAALVAIDHRLAQGVQVLGWVEHFEEALGLRPAMHHGMGLALKLYPRAHWEVIAHTRGQRIGGALTLLGMLQLHYYL